MKINAPAGTWPSSIDATQVGASAPQLNETLVEGGRFFWLESIPTEKNRVTIMMQAGEESQSLLPRPINVKSKVHEYGGGAFTVHQNNLYFVLADDQCIYTLDLGAPTCKPERITRESDGNTRFAELQVDARRQRLIAVCEQHSSLGTHAEPTNSLVSISLAKETLGQVVNIASGSDFYSNPRLSPDGNFLCWISWRHPNMPWDSTRLEVCRLNENGDCVQRWHREEDESLCQARWAPDNRLYVVSDRSDWWNIYRCHIQDPHIQLETTLNLDAEFSTPPWTFNMSNYAFLNSTEILASYTQNGSWALCKIALSQTPLQNITKLKQSSTVIYGLSAENNRALYLGANTHSANTLFCYSEKGISTIQQHSLALTKADISTPKTICFSTTNAEVTHGFYYPPCNAKYHDCDNLPPAIIICHGGPTGATDTALTLKIQFWTNRGFAVCDVNYRGSTGYGKSYRRRLYHQWGEVDVDDICAAANHLVQNKLADPDKLIIKGSSAGGYSVLAALAFRDTFKAGVSLYGIADLEILANDTHKFEARYMDTLVGPYPEQKTRYQQRSPIHAVNNFSCPLLVFQGLEDKVVPPNQAESIVNAVKQKGLPVGYRTFSDEGHGFRNIENIKTMLEDEWFFYCSVFDLPIPDTLQSTLKIDNVKAKH